MHLTTIERKSIQCQVFEGREILKKIILRAPTLNQMWLSGFAKERQHHFRCEDILQSCRRPNTSSESCCDEFFQPQPFLTMDGVCFTSNPLKSASKIQMFENIVVDVKIDKDMYAGKI